jgi:hypothetical protein
MPYVALGAGYADVSQTRSSWLRTRVNDVGSSSLLVIQVHESKIAMSEEKVADWKILVNQWRNEHSLRDELSHHLVFTKTDEEPCCCDEGWTDTRASHGLSGLWPHSWCIFLIRACVSLAAASTSENHEPYHNDDQLEQDEPWMEKTLLSIAHLISRLSS